MASIRAHLWLAAASLAVANAEDAPAMPSTCSVSGGGAACADRIDEADGAAHLQVRAITLADPGKSIDCTGSCPAESPHYYPTDFASDGNYSSTTPEPSAADGHQGVARNVGLRSCLQGGHGLQGANLLVRFPGDVGFNQDKKMVNRRPDIMPYPLALVDAATVTDVRAAVICAKQSSVQVCAKTGLHGFDNDAGCSGGIQIYMQGLKSYSLKKSVNGVPYTVEFGAGHKLGQLYYKLWFWENPGLMIPGGVVAGVGTSGLILGCGRGFFSQSHGLACDSVLAIKFVDANGDLQTANAHTNPDMFWMAKGSGGEFPGIVTEFTMRAYIAPKQIYEMVCKADKSEFGKVAKRWLAQGQSLSDNTKVFTHMTLWNHPQKVHLAMACMDCSAGEKSAMEGTFWWIWTGPRSECSFNTRTWMGQLLYESGVEDGAVVPPDKSALLDPWQGYGKRPGVGSAVAGARMGYDWWDWSTSPGSDLDKAIGEIEKYTYWDTVPGDYALFVGWYFTGGQRINDVDEQATAYGPRKSKFTIHYKHGWAAEQPNAAMMDHHHRMASSFDNVLPCTGFYNYKEPQLTCAQGNEELWLDAYFSNVTRMKLIKGAYDPQNIFRSRLTGIVGPTPTPLPTPAPLANLALKQIASASSTRRLKFKAQNAFDGHSHYDQCWSTVHPVALQVHR